MRGDVRERDEIIYNLGDTEHSAYCIIENGFPNDSGEFLTSHLFPSLLIISSQVMVLA